MDIAQLSTALSQGRVQQEAAVQVQKMAMDGAKDQGAALQKMMQAPVQITDPSLGNKVNILA
jgi:hypothetical protein